MNCKQAILDELEGQANVIDNNMRELQSEIDKLHGQREMIRLLRARIVSGMVLLPEGDTNG